METRDILLCPVCKGVLSKNGGSYKCENGHSFDISKESYVNLLISGKSGGLIGDNRDMARSRQRFLESGYFSPLADGIAEYIASLKKDKPVMLDICCGEGYYSKKALEKTDGTLFGFDISKEMVRLAAKRKLDALFFVANLSHIPMKSGSVDVAFHLFAPFHESEFSRVLKPDGTLLSVIPGENHLFELKRAVYEKPYKNDEKAPETSALKLADRIRIREKILLPSREGIQSLFKMTPYFYHTSEADKAKLDTLSELETTIDFVVLVYIQ